MKINDKHGFVTSLGVIALLCSLKGMGFAANNAQFVSQVVPSTMTAGQSYAVSVTMKNTGGTIWTRADGYKLGSQNPMDNITWGGRVQLATADIVAPGQEKTFSFSVTAPPAGTHAFQWRMVQESVEWFGATSPVVNVTVAPPAPAGLRPAGTVFSSTTTAVRLTWGAVAGATSYKVRATDLTDGVVRDPRNNCGLHYLCTDVTNGTSLDLSVSKGHSYTWWVHAVAGGVTGDPASAGFSVGLNNAQFVLRPSNKRTEIVH